MDEQTLKRDLFLLVGYLLTSAHGLYGEPPGYGPFRLLDAAGRLLHVMREHGMTDPYLDGLAATIDRERFGNSTDEELRQILNEIILDLVEHLEPGSEPAA